MSKYRQAEWYPVTQNMRVQNVIMDIDARLDILERKQEVPAPERLPYSEAGLAKGMRTAMPAPTIPEPGYYSNSDCESVENPEGDIDSWSIRQIISLHFRHYISTDEATTEIERRVMVLAKACGKVAANMAGVLNGYDPWIAIDACGTDCLKALEDAGIPDDIEDDETEPKPSPIEPAPLQVPLTGGTGDSSDRWIINPDGTVTAKDKPAPELPKRSFSEMAKYIRDNHWIDDPDAKPAPDEPEPVYVQAPPPMSDILYTYVYTKTTSTDSPGTKGAWILQHATPAQVRAEAVLMGLLDTQEEWILAAIKDHDMNLLAAKAEWLKGTDAEGWAVGELIERAMSTLFKKAAILEAAAKDASYAQS